jgi:tetratricopeptide (TPR) repeat protein
MFGKKDTNLKEEIITGKKGSKSKPQAKENKIEKFQEWIDNNRTKVMIISISIVAVTVLFFVIKSAIEKNNAENIKNASAALNRIIPYYAASDFQKSLSGDTSKFVRGQPVIGLINIVNEYGGTQQGKIAALYAGNCFLPLGKANEAIKYFEKALKSDGKIIQVGANAGLGAAYEMLLDFKSAVKYYEQASELSENDEIKYRYVYYTALCYEKAGNKEMAEKKYREVIDEPKYLSEFNKFARIGLTRLGTIIE